MNSTVFFFWARAGVSLATLSVSPSLAQAQTSTAVATTLTSNTNVAALSTLDLTTEASAQSLAKLKVQKLTLPSAPEYSENKSVTFEGYALEDILALLPKTEPTQDDKSLDVRFVANDGYVVTAHKEGLYNGKGVVAFRDVDAPAGEKWKTFLIGKTTVTPAPFFLVWGGGIKHDGDVAYPWPFQLARIELVSRDAAPAVVVPKSKDAKVVEGFNFYRTRCLVCHSVNLAGAEVGPEMNVPQNITEYRSRAYFNAFVRNPSSFRARSRMEAKNLSTNELDAVWAYLKSMKNQKVCSTAKACKDSKAK